MTSPLTLWRHETDQRIAQALAHTTAATAPAGGIAAEILGPLGASATGGKRLRALLLCAAHDAYRGTHHHAAAGFAAGLELFQTAALLHDDVLDDSDTRRGAPAAHKVIAANHAASGWFGSSDAFGAAGGILAGDLALMACYRSLRSAVAELDDTTAATTWELFADMADLVTMGQYADMRAAAQPLDALEDQRDQILTVMRTKTASYSAEFPLAMGAALAGASHADVTQIRVTGVDLGVAFQLRDDVLGLTGDSQVTGKPVGDDVREGKRTLLMWHTWREAGPEGRSLLAATLGNRDASDEEVARVIALAVESGAVAAAEAEISRLAEASRSYLTGADLAPQGRDALLSLVNQAVDRRA